MYDVANTHVIEFSQAPDVLIDIQFPPDIPGKHLDIQLPSKLPEMSLDIQFPSTGGGYPEYSGEYVITPETKAQVIPTEKKVLKQDLTVLAIPYSEVTNTANGITATIG